MNADYLRLLASFEVAVALEQRSYLIEPVLAAKILTLSGGTIGEIAAFTFGEIAALLRRSAAVASSVASNAYKRRGRFVRIRLAFATPTHRNDNVGCCPVGTVCASGAVPLVAPFVYALTVRLEQYCEEIPK